MTSGLVGRACRAALLALLALPACSRGGKKSDAQATASAVASGELPAPVASGFPAPEVVSQIVNPKAEKAYGGAAGTVRGRIVATGDPAPEQPSVLAQIPPKCVKAGAAYGKLFREGPNRELADVLVAVTGYQGYVPESESVVRVEADGCFWGSRTYALTFGQRFDIVSADDEAYVPELLGQRGQPQLIATPRGAATSPVYPPRPGRYQLIDNLKLFMLAEVVVLKYATHAVTGLDGRFEISGVPAGEVTVSAFLPQTQVSAEKRVVVSAGKPTDELIFEIPFDAAEAQRRAAAADAGAPPASASARGAVGAASGSARGRAPAATAPSAAAKSSAR